MVNLMERKKLWFGISLALLIPGLISLALWGLKLGIDFRGGSLIEFKYPSTAVEQGREAVKQAMMSEGITEIQIDSDAKPNETRLFVKTQTISEEKRANIVRRLNETQPPIELLSFESIDPQVSADVTRKAGLAIVFASLAIIGYIALSFRGVPKPASSWQFGVFAVLALLHDVVFIVGFYSLMGHFFGWEVKSEFVTAALTVMGFSVHDTIVVFDRLRENLRRFPSAGFTKVANISVTQTISRSLNTSLTVILVLLSMALLGGETIRPFTITLIAGIAVGTYSSIFVATPLLDWWQSGKKHFASLKKLTPRRRHASSRVKTA